MQRVNILGSEKQAEPTDFAFEDPWWILLPWWKLYAKPGDPPLSRSYYISKVKIKYERVEYGKPVVVVA